MKTTLNWRKPVIYSLLYLSGSKIPKRLKEIKTIANLSTEELNHYQCEKIKALLLYAFKYVPYYNKILSNSEVVIDGKVYLERFNRIPVLTKGIIKNEKDSLYSKLKRNKVYNNSSGGSTGEPLSFVQDQHYSDWNVANKIYYKTFANHDIGERELRLWGSERDLFLNKEKASVRIRNWLYNRKELNSFKMSKEGMHNFVKEWNKYKPQWVEAYTHSIYEFGRFIKEHGYSIYKPKGILTSAGTLYPKMKQEIEEVFKTMVFNRYGTREVGDIACSCEEDEGLHISTHNQYVEILYDDNSEYGKLLVTNLNNYAMPIIRYDIGDIAVVSTKDKCSCGRSFPLIGKIEGREMSMFKTKSGKLIPGEFFIHFIGVVFNNEIISKFQAIQKDYDKIIIKVIIKDEKKFKTVKEKIESSIKLVMENDCVVNWEFVEEIDSMRNGKYLYTICEI